MEFSFTKLIKFDIIDINNRSLSLGGSKWESFFIKY